MMEQMKVHTEFAPAGRASVDEIQRQRRLFQDAPLMDQILGTVPNILVVLNRERQITYANQSLYDVLDAGSENIDRVFGCRPGEILKCVHAFESEGGCGTTEFCSTCGAVKAILSSQENKADVQECRIIQDQSGDALDLRVWAKPLVLGDEVFTVFTIADISDEKRREALERIFFHDILNTAGGLKGSAELIRDADLEEMNEFQDIILRLSDDLIEEIMAQRQLAAAEKEELVAHPSVFDTGDVLKEIHELYIGHEVTRGRQVRIDDASFEGTLITDRALLRRVLGNMAKNALEASKLGETVTLGCEADELGTAFWVHNPGFIPPEIQLQIFQRSFSTKGTGRGLGTYSIKLLTERYLKGHASFGTSPEQGTVFRVVCPNLSLEEKPMPERTPASLKKEPRVLRVLIAEDNPVNQKLMSRLIERQGHTVVVADTGKAALVALAREPFDLVLMDCQMPEMDGFEATQTIRKGHLTQNADIPIVAMTGHTGKESREACLAAGMNDHVPKPVGKELLAEVLARWS